MRERYIIIGEVFIIMGQGVYYDGGGVEWYIVN